MLLDQDDVTKEALYYPYTSVYADNYSAMPPY